MSLKWRVACRVETTTRSCCVDVQPKPIEVQVISHNMQRYAVWFGGSMLAYTVCILCPVSWSPCISRTASQANEAIYIVLPKMFTFFYFAVAFTNTDRFSYLAHSYTEVSFNTAVHHLASSPAYCCYTTLGKFELHNNDFIKKWLKWLY